MKARSQVGETIQPDDRETAGPSLTLALISNPSDPLRSCSDHILAGILLSLGVSRRRTATGS
jgi:hypothetical protein